MTEAERQEIREKIILRIEEVKKDIANLREATQPIAPENSIGRLSRMDAINNKSVNEAALRSAKNRLVKLERALSNAEEEEFGKCIRCGEAIQVARMRFMPEVARCINCARRQ